MSARLRSIEHAVRPGDRRGSHKPKDVAAPKSKSGRDRGWVEEDDQEDEAADEVEHDDEGAEEDVAAQAEHEEVSEEEGSPLSLPKLAAAIRDAHQRCEQLRGRATEEALKIGRMLLEARKQVPHGGWLRWLKKVDMSERAAQRYLRLAKMETKLDDIAPSWRSELWPSEALAMLTEPGGSRGQVDEQDDDGEPADDTPPAEMDDDIGEGEDSAKDAKAAYEQAKLAAQKRKEARAIYGRAVAYLPKFRPAHWRFEPNSAELEALVRVERALVRVALSAARPFNTMVTNRNVPHEVQEVVVAMRLVERLFEKTKVEELFRPT